MQTIAIETSAQVEAAPLTPELQTPEPALVMEQHRIYVWSSPSPFAVVVEESRSFARHG